MTEPVFCICCWRCGENLTETPVVDGTADLDNLRSQGWTADGGPEWAVCPTCLS